MLCKVEETRKSTIIYYSTGFRDFHLKTPASAGGCSPAAFSDTGTRSCTTTFHATRMSWSWRRATSWMWWRSATMAGLLVRFFGSDILRPQLFWFPSQTLFLHSTRLEWSVIPIRPTRWHFCSQRGRKHFSQESGSGSVCFWNPYSVKFFPVLVWCSGVDIPSWNNLLMSSLFVCFTSGTSRRSKLFGTFPGNYVKQL